MPRRLFNWNFDQVTTFLRNQHFQLHHVEGSHHYYVGFAAGQLRQVCVPFHGQVEFKPRTLKGMIRQSGIDQKEWLK